MFTEVRLTNFKSFNQEEAIPLRRISVFIGPNGGGKSSVLQALLVWSQSVGRPTLQPSGLLVDLGELEDLIAAPEAPSSIGFTVTKELPLPALAASVARVRVDAKVDATLANPPDAVLDISSEPFNLTWRRQESAISVVPQECRQPNGRVALSSKQDLLQPIAIGARNGDWQRLERDLLQLANVAATALSEMRYVPALRGFAAARYSLGEASRNDFAQSTSVQENADRLATTLAYNDELRGEASRLLTSLTGVTLDRELVPNRRTAPVSRRPKNGATSKNVVPTNEGFGTNQLVHLLSQTLVTPDEGTVLVEEPETHLHPSAQTKLGMWLAEHAIEHKKQFLITTHSERFLGALLWQVRKEVLQPADIVVYFITLSKEGHSVVQRRNVTHGGLIQGSFRDFFSDPSEAPEWNEFFKGL